MVRIDSLFRGDRIQDAQGNTGAITYDDIDAVHVEFTDGSRHLYYPYTQVTALDPEPLPAVLGRATEARPVLFGR